MANVASMPRLSQDRAVPMGCVPPGGAVRRKLVESSAALEPKYRARRVRNLRIPMPDGITLAADAWMPDADGRFPVVFDYYPYRKNDHPDSAYVGHRYL